MNKTEIIGLALECGFMISTAYGQDKNQPMPVSDTATLIDFANKIRKWRPEIQQLDETDSADYSSIYGGGD